LATKRPSDLLFLPAPSSVLVQTSQAHIQTEPRIVCDVSLFVLVIAIVRMASAAFVPPPSPYAWTAGPSLVGPA
jgi:hypothetical protein